MRSGIRGSWRRRARSRRLTRRPTSTPRLSASRGRNRFLASCRPSQLGQRFVQHFPVPILADILQLIVWHLREECIPPLRRVVTARPLNELLPCLPSENIRALQSRVIKGAPEGDRGQPSISALVMSLKGGK